MRWQPSASLANLAERSHCLQQLRAFFYARSCLEVDVPIFNLAPVSDVHLNSLCSFAQLPGSGTPQAVYAHTSPEYKMKQLLCAGMGDIFYLGKVFRDGDVSQRHQIEFCMLEWYRLGFNLQDLMAEVGQLIQSQLGPLPIETLSYQAAFAQFAGIENIFTADAATCQACLIQHQIPEVIGVAADDKTLWEQLVLSEVVEPQLGQGKLTFLTHFPLAQAALARPSENSNAVCERFEVYVAGLELANGYHELQDAEMHRQRFEENLANRASLNLPAVPLDEAFLTALDFGLPNCSGVALGVDRLLMLKLGASDIAEVVPFALTGESN